MMHPLPARRAVALVVRREFRAQVVRKSFVISNAIVLLVVAGGIVAYSMFGGSGDDRPAVGVAGSPPLAATVAAAGERLGVPVEVRPVGSVGAGRDAVAAGDLDVVVAPAGSGPAAAGSGPAGSGTVPADDGSIAAGGSPGTGGTSGAIVAIVDEEVPAPLRAVLDAAAERQARDAALAGLGVDPAALDRGTAPAVVTVEALDPPDPEAGQRTTLSVVALLLLFGQILGFGTYVAMGVVEEKSSRVVELLLSTIRPLHLLCGKILGIGAVGLLQLALYGAVGLAAGTATGLLTLTGTAVAVFAGVLGWFVLGFAFYAVLYAAAGSMVSRQEDVNSTTAPLMLSLFLLYGAAFGYLGSPDATWVTVLSWIPPFPAILMPLKIADGSATAPQIAGTVAAMLVAVAALAWLGARIYHRSVLRIGATVPWREALGPART